MPDDVTLPQRRSVRLPRYDYTQRGAYFVTICTLNRACLFGQVVAGEMHLSEAGEVARLEWRRSAEMRREIVLDEFIIMPDHLHGIVVIHDTGGHRYDDPAGSGDEHTVGFGNDDADGDGKDACVRRTETGVRRTPLQRPARASLGAFINGYKASVTRGVTALRIVSGVSVWQRNYYEHIIRDEADLERIRQYIRLNPARWANDRNSPSHP